MVGWEGDTLLLENASVLYIFSLTIMYVPWETQSGNKVPVPMAKQYQFIHACVHSTLSSKHYTFNVCRLHSPKTPYEFSTFTSCFGSTFLNVRGLHGKLVFCANNKSNKNNHVLFIIKKKKQRSLCAEAKANPRSHSSDGDGYWASPRTKWVLDTLSRMRHSLGSRNSQPLEEDRPQAS